jgi:class 3 adenylate cyclase
VKALEAGADDFLTKPVDRTELTARVRNSLKVKEYFDTIDLQNRQLLEAYEIIKREQGKSDQLLLNVLPEKIANELKYTGKTRPETFHNVTVMFSDVVGFTRMFSELEPEILIGELNEIVTAFDRIIEKNSCERIKTIGDAYLAVCGMPEANEKHADNIVNSAVEIIDFLKDRNSRSGRKWEVRIGVHSGKVVGGIVGIKKYIYDVFGDTINVVSRMEHYSEPMKINVSETTHGIVRNRFAFVERAPVEVKGKGNVKMYFVDTRKEN